MNWNGTRTSAPSSNGLATAAEVTDAVIESESLPEDPLEQTNRNGQSKVRDQIAWTCMYLVHSGHIDSSTRGVWRLTEKGQHVDLARLNLGSLFKRVQSAFKSGPEENTAANGALNQLMPPKASLKQSRPSFSQSSRHSARRDLRDFARDSCESMDFSTYELLGDREMGELMAKGFLPSILF